MTAIAGFCENGKVWIGGDSAGVSGMDLTIRADQKVFVARDFIYGFTSSFRMGQLLRYSLSVPRIGESQDIHEFMCTAYIDAVRNCLRNGGYAARYNERESAGSFLVGHRGRLFAVDYDYQVGESRDGYMAVGSGEQVAHGALFATSDLRGEERMIKVLSAAENHNTGVRRPFVICSL